MLGGSFNPAHPGHLHIARLALRRLRLGQVWLMVSPGNPLKEAAGMSPMPDRLASARALLASHHEPDRRILATDIEARLGTRYTIDTLHELQTRFPRARFVWLMGADILEQLPQWRRWMELARMTVFAVLPRPTYNHRALAGQAARRLRPCRRLAQTAPALAAPALAPLAAPAWVFLPAAQHSASATAIRAAETGV